MKSNLFLCAAIVCLLSCFSSATARAQETESSEDDKSGAAGVPPGEGMLSNPEDPQNQLPLIRQRRAEKDAVFRVSPLQKAHENTNRRNAALKEKTGLGFGMNSNTLIQWLTEVLPDADNSGVATTFDFVGTWEAINRGKPSLGQVLFQLEGRWDYGTTGQTIFLPLQVYSGKITICQD